MNTRFRLAPLALALMLAGAQARAETIYYQRGEAQAELERRQAQGEDATIRTERRPARLHQVQLPYFQTRAAAELAAQKLRQLGAKSHVILPKERYGYTIGAGSFTEAASAERRMAELRAQGFANLRLRELDGELIAYRVASRGRLAARPKPPMEAGPAAPTPAAPVAPAPASSAEATEFSFAETPGGAAEETLSFGAAEDTPGGGAGPAPKTVEVRLAELRLEAGLPLASGNAADSLGLLRLNPSLSLKPSDSFSIELAARIDHTIQDGEASYSDTDLDYQESFLRWRGESTRLTLGAQTVLWGRMDDLSPTNLYVRQDLSRYTLEDIADRYQPQAAARFEFFAGAHKFEALALPWFDPSRLAQADSIWHPVASLSGQIQGTAPDPLLAALVRYGRFEDEPEGEDEDRVGGGLRYSHAGQGLDFGVTALRVQPTTPYVRLNPAVRDALFLGLPPPLAVMASPDATFQAVYPQTDLVGADLAFTAWDATWRAELVYTSDNPVTGPLLALDTVPAWSFAAGVEIYPGDGNNRLTLQVNGKRLVRGDYADPDELYSLSGELENGFAQDSWRLRTRLLTSWAGGERDYYLSSELAWLAWEPQEFYLSAHGFGGDAATASGFHRDHDLVLLGWRTRF